MALTFASGNRLTPSRLNALVPVEAVKSGNTARTSTTTMTADPHLVVAIAAASATYDVEAHLMASSAANAAGDVQYDFTYPSGATLTLQGIGPHNSLASGSQTDGEWFYVALDSSSPTAAMPFGASAAGAGAFLKGRLVVGTTIGNLTLRWAQQGSNVNATTLQAGSYLRLRRVG